MGEVWKCNRVGVARAVCVPGGGCNDRYATVTVSYCQLLSVTPVLYAALCQYAIMFLPPSFLRSGEVPVTHIY